MNKVRVFNFFFFFIFHTLCFAQKNKSETYFPAPNNWLSKNPVELGLNP